FCLICTQFSLFSFQALAAENEKPDGIERFHRAFRFLLSESFKIWSEEGQHKILLAFWLLH
ncbi:hypothetical protein B1R32_1101, partial [Abditibacterium utsteinense]